MLETKLDKFTNLFNRVYLSHKGREAVSRTYLAGITSYWLQQNHFSESSLKKCQSLINKYVQPKSSSTAGFQRYLPTRKAGAGATNLVALSKSLKVAVIQKLLQKDNPIGKFPRTVLRLLGIDTDAILWAAKWEIKVIGYYLREAGLSFWEELLLLYLDLREKFYDVAETNAQYRIPLTEGKPWMSPSQIKRSGIMLPFKDTQWLDKITIFNKQYKQFISLFPLRSQLLNTKGQIIPQEKIQELANLLNQGQCTIPIRNAITSHMTRKQLDFNPNLQKPTQGCILGEALASQAIRSLNKNTYLALIREKAMKDFSASSKWLKAGFNYPPDVIFKASARISDAKAPAIYKSTALKYLLRGYRELKSLAKQGRRDSHCYFCQQMENVDFEHVFLFCPAALYIRSHIDEVVYRHTGTIIQWSLDAFNLMSNTGNKLQSAVAIAAKITFVGVLHLEIHKKTKTYSTSEEKLLEITNKIFSDLKIVNSNFLKCSYIRKRLKYSKLNNSFFKSFHKLRMECLPNGASQFYINRANAEVTNEEALIIQILTQPSPLADITHQFQFS